MSNVSITDLIAQARQLSKYVSEHIPGSRYKPMIDRLANALEAANDSPEVCPDCHREMEYVGTPDGASGYMHCWDCYYEAKASAPLHEGARFDAYYYGFEPTGVGTIDAILSAIAIAGKSAHHTENWDEESEYGYYTGHLGLVDGDSAVDLIQKNADRAAKAFNSCRRLPIPVTPQSQVSETKTEGDL